MSSPRQTQVWIISSCVVPWFSSSETNFADEVGPLQEEAAGEEASITSLAP